MGGASLERNPVGLSGCPCGRYHPSHTVRHPPRGPTDGLAQKTTEALWAGKAAQDADTGVWHVSYHGDCSQPLMVAANDDKSLFTRRYVRCRRCPACLRAKRNYWGFAAMNMTVQAEAAGRRSWFGTLTLNGEWQAKLLLQAMAKHWDRGADWWSDPHCDERFRFVCDEFHSEVRKYFRRLRHRDARFKYFLVYERHKSGLPHAHFIIHEDDRPILKRILRDEWPLGFMQAKLIGGRAHNAPAPEKAAWYAVKYLTKSVQARVKASPGYRPEKRPKVHSGSV